MIFFHQSSSFISAFLAFCLASSVTARAQSSGEAPPEDDVTLRQLQQEIQTLREVTKEQRKENQRLKARVKKLEQRLGTEKGEQPQEEPGSQPASKPEQEEPDPAKEGAPKAEDGSKQKKAAPSLHDKVDQLEEEMTKLRFRIPESPEPIIPEGLQSQEEPNALNPVITVFSDHLYRADDREVIRDGHDVSNKYRLRANEIDIRGAVGPWADATAIFAVPEMPDGSFGAEFEELYLTVKDYPFFEEPPLDLRVKLGRFRPEMGRMNRLHFHDMPQPDRPFAFRQFMGGEGWHGEGASARMQLPTPFDPQSALELTLQGLEDSQGLRFAEGGGSATDNPGGVANLRWSRAFGDEHFADVAFIGYHGRGDNAGLADEDTTVYSIDSLYKWKPAKRGAWRSFILGGQAYWGDREVVRSGIPTDATPFGYYAWTQYQFNRRWNAGIRWDYSEAAFNDDLETRAIEPYITYTWSEPLRTRIGYRHQWSDIPVEDGLDTLFFELTFWFGSHPPHPFWVER